MSDTGRNRTRVTRESAISAVINGTLSFLFFAAIFGFAGPVGVWGAGGYVFDFLPQGFAVAFFGALVPTLLTGRSVKRGSIAARGSYPAGSHILLGALVAGLLAAVIGAAIWALLLRFAGTFAIDAATGCIAKVIYGALLGGTITRLRLTRLLA